MRLFHRLSVLAAAAVTAVIGFVGPADAQNRGREFFVECPQGPLRARVVVETDGAWQTPRDRGELVDTRVAERRSGRTLECGYALFRTTLYLRQAFPQQAVACEPQPNGFVCRRPRQQGGGGGAGGSGPVDGAFTLRGGDVIDLDGSLRGAGAPDLTIQRRGSLVRALATVGDAGFAVMGFEPPARRDCAAARYNAGRLDLGRLDQGLYLCIRTNGRRYARIQIARIDRQILGRSRVDFTYRVWRRRF